MAYLKEIKVDDSFTISENTILWLTGTAVGKEILNLAEGKYSQEFKRSVIRVLNSIPIDKKPTKVFIDHDCYDFVYFRWRNSETDVSLTLRCDTTNPVWEIEKERFNEFNTRIKVTYKLDLTILTDKYLQKFLHKLFLNADIQ